MEKGQKYTLKSENVTEQKQNSEDKYFGNQK